MASTVSDAGMRKRARIALEWWAQYPTRIPIHAVARGLHTSYRDVRSRVAPQLLSRDSDGEPCVPAAEAYRLYREVYGS